METIEKIVVWLEEKNSFLQKFHDLNEEEIQRYMKGDFESLERFYDSREALLDMIRHMDELVLEAQEQIVTAASPAPLRERVEKALNIKDDLVTRILAQDLQILSLIDAEKSNIIRDLRQMGKSKVALSAYRGPDLDKRLDEEF